MSHNRTPPAVTPEFWAADCQGNWALISIPEPNADGEHMCVSYSHSEKDEEGWYAEHRMYAYHPERGEAGVVEYTAVSSGRDCDGYHRTVTVYECPLDKLASVTPHQACELPKDALLPAWEEQETDEHDQYARASGY